jgi:malate dehydrogenase (oxaloacetate-decarboxylating)(NADP+)
MPLRNQADPAESPPTLAKGVGLLHDPARNKGTAFSESERDALGLRGLLPPRVQTQAQQLTRVLENLRRKTSDLEKYVFLTALQDRNETLFHRLLQDHLDELMPLIYTPTVGEACQNYAHIFRRPRGLYVSARDAGRVRDLLANWPHRDARMVVVTDGERILGLGDLGAAGMGIPIGKLALYTACAGVHPARCLPIMLDVGTDNQALLDDPLYIGLPQRRLRGEPYDRLVDEMMTALVERFPKAVIQLEDFASANAFRLLARYRDRMRLFDDDIQGTASVTLAGLVSALRVTGSGLQEQRLLFLGAGEAGTGIGELVVAAMTRRGTAEPEARHRCWFFDSQGLVVAGRAAPLADHKRPFAHASPSIGDFLTAVQSIRPTVLIGVSGAAGAFTRPILESMAAINRRPIIFALSNPTSRAECTAEEAYRFTAGRALYASGSPFAPVEVEGTRHEAGQANNAYVFPGVGLGALVSGASRITDEMFLAAAHLLAEMVTEDDLRAGRLFPPLGKIRDVSARIAEAVARLAWEQGLASGTRPEPLLAHIRSGMYEPVYTDDPGSTMGPLRA